MPDTWEWRCVGRDPTKADPCNKLLGKFEDLRSGEIMCPRCHFLNRATLPAGATEVILAARARPGDGSVTKAAEILNTAQLMGLSRRDTGRIRLYEHDLVAQPQPPFSKGGRA